MTSSLAAGYLLEDPAHEAARLTLQAQVWEPAAERLFDAVGVRLGWDCLDAGCGAMGVLPVLARRTGGVGRVVGLDADPAQLEAARVLAGELGGVEVVEGDVFALPFAAREFDLVHARFVLAPLGRPDALLASLIRVTATDGVLAVQEPDISTWTCEPAPPAWAPLVDAIVSAVGIQGGDLNAGRRLAPRLRSAGLRDVRSRTETVQLPPGHPYAVLPAHFARSLRSRILAGGRYDPAGLDAAIREVEASVQEPGRVVTTFTVVQAWARV